MQHASQRPSFLLLQVKSTFPVKLFATNVVLLVPVPDQTARASFNLTAGGSHATQMQLKCGECLASVLPQ